MPASALALVALLISSRALGLLAIPGLGAGVAGG